ncbi:putative uncharacterized protein DDB_G0285119 [Schistocerca cancellata]|uniref:putative uncharacterized protein DDB_G0285119 n=1 Tax=Schistocerca cancellata TaxID=274614 RepID=UPI0021178888|nr:putative uncharacterized protein DDB_G0285119 [Schistocerca cancellata]
MNGSENKKSQSKSSPEGQEDFDDFEEDTEDSMGDSTEREGNSESEFADDEDGDTRSEGDNVEDSVTVKEEDPIEAAQPASGGNDENQADTKPNIKIEPDPIEAAQPASGGNDENQADTKPNIKIEPVPVKAEADGDGVGQAGYTMERKPNIKQEQGVIPETNHDVANNSEDYSNVIIKEEIDIGEDYLEKEPAFQGPAIKDEANGGNNNNNNNNNNMNINWIPMQEITLVAHRANGPEVVGALLVPQGPGE